MSTRFNLALGRIRNCCQSGALSEEQLSNRRILGDTRLSRGVMTSSKRIAKRWERGAETSRDSREIAREFLSVRLLGVASLWLKRIAVE